MIFDQRPELQRARALRRVHHEASEYTERQAAQDRVTNELNAWKAMHSNFDSLSASERMPLVLRAAMFPCIVFFDALLVSQAGQALAQGMSGGNYYAGLLGLLGLPFVLALAELSFAHRAEEELKETGHLSTRTILLWVFVSAIPVASAFFALQGIAAAFGADSEQKVLGYGGAALIAALHLCLILTAQSIMTGMAYCTYAIRNARLERQLRAAGTRLARTRRAFEKSWLTYYAHLHVDGQPDLPGGPFSVAVIKALQELFNITIQQAGPAGGSSQQAAPGTPAPAATVPIAQPASEAAASEQPGAPFQPGPSSTQENLWNNITRRKAS
jgi:hypothetical protein